MNDCIERKLIKQIPVLLEKPFLEKGDRLVCFGDSITEEPTGYVSFLAKKLEVMGIELINAGVGGDKTTTALPRIFPDVINHKPTAVSIFFGANDFCHGHGRWSHEPQIAWQTLRDNLKWIVHICRLNGIQKFSINVLPDELEGTVLAEYGSRMEHLRATQLAAEEAKTLCVNLNYVFGMGKNFHEYSENGLLYTRDGIHPTEFAAEIIAETMLHCWKMD